MARAADKRVLRAPILYPFVDGVSEAQPHQVEFHRSKAKVKLALWGIGAGKSVCSAVEAYRWILAYPRKAGVIVAQTGPLLERTILPKMEAIHDAFKRTHGVPLIMQYEKSRKIFHFINGHTAYLIPSDEPEKLRGPEYIWAWLEEFAVLYRQEEVFGHLVQRARIYPEWCIFGSSSPLPGSWLIRHVKDRMAQGDPEYFLSRYASTANRLVRPENLEILRASMSSDRWKLDVEADETATLNHAVYAGSFHPRDSVRPFNPAVLRNDLQGRYALTYVVDWGESRGHMLAIVEDMEDRCHYIVDDVPLRDGGVEKSVHKVMERVKELHGLWGKWPSFIITDPTGKRWNRLLKNRLNNGHIQLRATFWKEPKQIQWGIEQVKFMLQSATGDRRLFMAAHLLTYECNRDGGPGTYQSFLQYHYRTTRDGEVIPVAVDDEKHTHSMDCIRMYCMHMRPTREAEKLAIY